MHVLSNGQHRDHKKREEINALFACILFPVFQQIICCGERIKTNPDIMLMPYIDFMNKRCVLKEFSPCCLIRMDVDSS